MKRATKALLAGILVATAALLLAYSLGRFWLGATAALAVGLWGWFGAERKWDWASDLFLVGVMVLVTLGTLAQLPSFLLLFALLGALAAWDLGRFVQRLRNAPLNSVLPAMEERHLSLLILAIALGGTLSAAGLIIRVPLSFGLTLFLGMALVVLIERTIRRLKS